MFRSYSLRPGSMYDWSNYWAKGIGYRSAVRPDIPYAGLFTQLGELHTIYHMWCYNDMADRKGCREATWHYPEWNDVVANTVPLVKTMKTRDFTSILELETNLRGSFRNHGNASWFKVPLVLLNLRHY